MNVHTLDTEKAKLRRTALDRRASAHQQTGATAAKRAASHLIDHILRIPAIETVAGYLPIRTEIDPRPSMLGLIEHGLKICVPIVAERHAPLRFRGWTPDVPLEIGAYGAPIPTEGDEITPDLLIVPLLAFDGRGVRLGYGGGYYDRTLAGLRRRGRAYGIGLSYAAQMIESLPEAPTDVRLDAVVTETGLHYPREPVTSVPAL